MNLQSFLDKKVVILPENCTVEEAAKAMAHQKVGSVIVKGRDHKIIGIVTDRDIACHAVAEELAPETALGDLIAVEEMAYVTEDSNIDNVTHKMIKHGVRRIPVLRNPGTEKETCVGIVTLDDLILTDSIDIKTAKEVIKPQVRIFEHQRSQRFQKRKEARMEQSQNIFYKTLAREMDLTKEEAEPHIHFLLKTLVERISYTEASDLISSLPKLIQTELWNAPAGPNRNIDAEFVVRQMQVRHGFTKPHCERLVRGFWIGLELYLLNNEGLHILSQLPADMQILFNGEVIEKSPISRRHIQNQLRE